MAEEFEEQCCLVACFLVAYEEGCFRGEEFLGVVDLLGAYRKVAKLAFASGVGEVEAGYSEAVVACLEGAEVRQEN